MTGSFFSFLATLRFLKKFSSLDGIWKAFVLENWPVSLTHIHPHCDELWWDRGLQQKNDQTELLERDAEPSIFAPWYLGISRDWQLVTVLQDSSDISCTSSHIHSLIEELRETRHKSQTIKKQNKKKEIEHDFCFNILIAVHLFSALLFWLNHHISPLHYIVQHLFHFFRGPN